MFFKGRKPKRRLHRKKIMKGMFYYHKGNMLWKYHAYQPNRNTKEIMLCYDKDGNESYFTNWKEAKHYIRRMPPRKDLWDDSDFEPMNIQTNSVETANSFTGLHSSNVAFEVYP